MLKPALLALAALTLAACGDREDPAKAAQRTASRRAACVAEELAIQANTKVSSLDTMRTRMPDSFVAQVFPFAQAYFDYAKLRERQAAWTDSAVAATSKADSTRYAGQAARTAPGRGRPGSIEANAAQSYDRDFIMAMNNPDHPCNQESAEAEQ
jgi:hypothetical protein